LRPDETCYFLCDAVHHTARGVASASRPSQGGLRRKLADGTYWRNASVGTIHLADDAWQATEPGKLYLTNQRLIFRNSELEMVVYLDSIADFDHYRNGIFLHRHKGEPIFLATPTGADVAAMILGRTLRER
jgi:hypothetical protein